MTDNKKQPLLMDADGWYRWEIKLTDNFSISPILAEEHGLTNRRPPLCSVQARPDRPPVVRIITPNEEIAVRPDDKVPVTFVATDDVRVGSAELVVYDEGGKPGTPPRILDTIPIPLGEQEGATEVKATVELDLSKYRVMDGAELSFAVRVREDRSLAPQLAAQHGATQQLPNAPAQETSADPVVGPTSRKEFTTAADLDGAPINSSDQMAPASLANTGEQQPSVVTTPSAAADTAPDSQVSDSAPQSGMPDAVDLPRNTHPDEQKENPAESVAQGNPVGSSTATSEPSAITKSIADAIPEGLKDLATETVPRTGLASNTPSENDSMAANTGEGQADKETLSDRQALNTAASPGEQPLPEELGGEPEPNRPPTAQQLSQQSQNSASPKEGAIDQSPSQSQQTQPNGARAKWSDGWSIAFSVGAVPTRKRPERRIEST